MKLQTRQSIKVLLLNEAKELLLILVDDPQTTNLDGTYHGPFWCLVGGGTDHGETVQETALREIYEETGIEKKDVELGPVVWYGSYDFIRIGTPTHMEEQFIIEKQT